MPLADETLYIVSSALIFSSHNKGYVTSIRPTRSGYDDYGAGLRHHGFQFSNRWLTIQAVGYFINIGIFIAMLCHYSSLTRYSKEFLMAAKNWPACMIMVADGMTICWASCPRLPSDLWYKWHLIRQYNCWPFRCNWRIACRRCSNFIFLTHCFNGLVIYNFKTRETF